MDGFHGRPRVLPFTKSHVLPFSEQDLHLPVIVTLPLHFILRSRHEVQAREMYPVKTIQLAGALAEALVLHSRLLDWVARGVAVSIQDSPLGNL